jgi:hypothetical protein
MSRPRTRQDAVDQGGDAAIVLGLREWLDELTVVRETPFAAFDTRVDIVRRLPGSAARAAAKVARQRGYTPLTRPESFYVQDVSGPLLEGEIQRAEAWGEQIAELLTGKLRYWA